MGEFTVKILRHLAAQPFVVATGIAALVHSTWSIATYFSGPEPDGGFSWHWLGWAAVAFLIAFSMDIGQIVTSAEIREGKRTWTKYLTFFVFAAATYYAQFLYISSHMPVIPLAPGVRRELADFIQWARDLAVFILPALLPASTLLYTFSHEKPAQPTVENKPTLAVENGQGEAIAPINVSSVEPSVSRAEAELDRIFSGPAKPYTAEELERLPEDLERWRKHERQQEADLAATFDDDGSEGSPDDRPLSPRHSPNGHGPNVNPDVIE